MKNFQMDGLRYIEIPSKPQEKDPFLTYVNKDYVLLSKWLEKKHFSSPVK